MKVPRIVFTSGRGLKAGDVLAGKRILSTPVIHLGMVHYFVLSRDKKVEHKQIPADKEVKIRRPRYNHVVFIPPKAYVAQQNHTAHADAPKEGPAGPTPTVDKIMKQLANFF